MPVRILLNNITVMDLNWIHIFFLINDASLFLRYACSLSSCMQLLAYNSAYINVSNKIRYNFAYYFTRHFYGCSYIGTLRNKCRYS